MSGIDTVFQFPVSSIKYQWYLARYPLPHESNNNNPKMFFLKPIVQVRGACIASGSSLEAAQFVQMARKLQITAGKGAKSFK